MDFSKLPIMRELAKGFLESVQRRTSVRGQDSTTSGPNRATRAETLPSGIVVRSWRPNVGRAPRPAADPLVGLVAHQGIRTAQVPTPLRPAHPTRPSPPRPHTALPCRLHSKHR